MSPISLVNTTSRKVMTLTILIKEFCRLGIQITEFSQFFSILKELVLKFMKVFTQQPPEFHPLLSQILCNSPKDTELDTLPLIPLRDGRWIRQVDGQCHFGTDDARLLQKLSEGVDDLRIADATVSRDPIRRKLFTRLGVKDLNNTEACRLIIVRLCPFSLLNSNA
jgi:hypothetical protein